MTRVIAIFGSPRAGKSTIMRAVKDKISPLWLQVKHKQMIWESSSAAGAAIIGKYDDGDVFGGTDKLSMSVHKEALEWFNKEAKLYNVVLFEGDRLCSSSFLKSLEEILHLELIPVWIHCEDEYELQRRARERGSNQNETWLKSRETKVKRLVADYQDSVVTIQNQSKYDLPKAVKKILKLICQ